MNFLQGLGAYLGAVQLMEQGKRKTAYSAARESALLSGKPLVVVGGNKNRHPPGDVCVDLNPGSCTGGRFAYIQADIRRIPLPDGYAGAVYASHVLEHLPTVEQAQLALAELSRIGGDVYVVAPSKLDPIAWIHPDHHLWVHAGASGIRFEQRRR